METYDGQGFQMETYNVRTIKRHHHHAGRARTRMDEGVSVKKCVCCMQWWCCVFLFWQGLVNRSMRIQDLYVGAFPRFIRNIPIRCWGGDVYREEEVCISARK